MEGEAIKESIVCCREQ